VPQVLFFELPEAPLLNYLNTPDTITFIIWITRPCS